MAAPPPSSRRLQVLAVTGLAREARLAAGPGVATVGAGGNTARLRALLAAREPPDCRAVVSFGIAGGLDPGLAPGDVVVATAVVSSDAARDVGTRLRTSLVQQLAGVGSRVVLAPLAGSDVAVMSVEGKRALRAATGAAAVDMESHVAAAFAARHGLPFCAVRAVCDPAGRALPAFVAHALTPDGEPDVRAALAALARRAVTPGELWRLARDSSAAFRALRRCRAALGSGLGLADLGELLGDVA